MTESRDENPNGSNVSTRRQALAGGVAGAATVLFGFTRKAWAQADLTQTLVQTAQFNLDLEKEEEGLEALRTLTQAVEEKEPGVLAYVCHRSKNDPSIVFFYEVYENQEAQTAHGQTEHIGALRGLFGSGVLQMPATITPMEVVGGFLR